MPAAARGSRPSAPRPAVDQAFDVLVEPDGRIVVAGMGRGGALVNRFAADGSTVFGRGLGFSGATGVFHGLARQQDGRLVAAGESGGNVVAARVLPNPDLDPDDSFAPGAFPPAFGDDLASGPGLLELDYGGGEGARDVLVQPDGRIVIVGFASASGLALVTRRLATGALDQDFGSDFVDFTGVSDEFKGVAIQADGKLVVAGSTIGTDANSNLAVARLSPVNGDLDPSFSPGGADGDGKLELDLGGTDVAEDVLVQPDGAIVLAGRGGPGRDIQVVRLTPAGSLDPSFGGGGRLAVDFGGSDEGNAAVLQGDGKIAVAGLSNAAHAVARIQPGGAPDTTFSGDGKTTFGFPTGFAGGAANALALQADGKLVTAGYVLSNARDIALARLQGGGSAAGGPGAGPSGGAGGAGRPPRCGGKPATIVGTPQKDRLRGTRRADVIAALGGNDTVTALGGDDIVCGGAGRDVLRGGPGTDRLLGQAGDDRLLGGPGVDRLLGQAGRDVLLGGPGLRDLCLGGVGRDRAACERGRG